MGKKFRSLIKRGSFRLEHNEKFFQQTNPANASCRVEIRSPCYHWPPEAVADIVVFQVPNILAECGPLLCFSRPVCHVMTVTIPSAFECSCSYPCVGLTVAVVQPSNLCPVNKTADQAVTSEGTCCPVHIVTVAVCDLLFWLVIISRCVSRAGSW